MGVFLQQSAVAQSDQFSVFTDARHSTVASQSSMRVVALLRRVASCVLQRRSRRRRTRHRQSRQRHFGLQHASSLLVVTDASSGASTGASSQRGWLRRQLQVALQLGKILLQSTPGVFLNKSWNK
jgi:hypothetical protein